MRRTTLGATLAVIGACALAGCPIESPTGPGPASTTTTTTTTTPPTSTAGIPVAWGYNGFGNVGNGTLSDQPSPVTVALPLGVQALDVSAGGFHTLVRGNNGVTYAVGRDDNGELGNDAAFAYQVTAVPVAAPAGVRFVQVSAGGNHSLAIGDDGRTYAWGLDAQGQLGDDAALVNRPEPVLVATPPGVRFVAVSAGFAHSLAIGDDGRLYAWGYNFYSELGNDSTHLDRPTPVSVATPVGVTFTRIAAGGHHNLAVATDGTTYAWGWDGYGQIGDGAPFADRDLPTPVSRPAGVTFAQVAAGAHHSLGVTADGRVYAWGSDEEGELGDDVALTDRAAPVPVALPAGIAATSITAGGRHSVAAGSDGRVYVWGSDASGQQGDGPPPVDHAVPTAVELGGTALSVSAGYYHVVARRAP